VGIEKVGKRRRGEHPGSPIMGRTALKSGLWGKEKLGGRLHRNKQSRRSFLGGRTESLEEKPFCRRKIGPKLKKNLGASKTLAPWKAIIVPLHTDTGGAQARVGGILRRKEGYCKSFLERV